MGLRHTTTQEHLRGFQPPSSYQRVHRLHYPSRGSRLHGPRSLIQRPRTPDHLYVQESLLPPISKSTNPGLHDIAASLCPLNSSSQTRPSSLQLAVSIQQKYVRKKCCFHPNNPTATWQHNNTRTIYQDHQIIRRPPQVLQRIRPTQRGP